MYFHILPYYPLILFHDSLNIFFPTSLLIFFMSLSFGPPHLIKVPCVRMGGGCLLQKGIYQSGATTEDYDSFSMITVNCLKLLRKEAYEPLPPWITKWRWA